MSERADQHHSSVATAEPRGAHAGHAHGPIVITKPTAEDFAALGRYQVPALIIGVVAMGISLIQLFVNAEQFLLSYLFAFVYWIGIPLGCLGILQLQHMTGGGWGLLIRRPLEAGTRVLPLMAILSIPLLLGASKLYVWFHEPLRGLKGSYLTTTGFILRTILYLAVWMMLSFLLNRWSAEQDQTNDPSILRKFQKLSGAGIILYVIATTMAAIDWIMSLDPHWVSTMYGLLLVAGQILAALAFVIVVLAILADRKPFADVITPGLLTDLGNLLLAFTMVWAYFGFSQYLIIWAGNVKEETPYYIYRTQGVWQWIAISLILVHFFIPFALLLGRRTKRNIRSLAAVAGLIVLMRFVDLFWVIVPMNDQGHHRLEARSTFLHWTDVLIPIGMGGIWIATYIGQLRRRPLIAPNDPRLEELEVAHHG